MQIKRVVVGVLTAGALSACGAEEDAAPVTVTQTQTQTSYVEAAPVAPAGPDASAPGAPAPTAAAESWTMPNLIGRNLQAAQDAIQELTDYKISFSTSTDLTGEGRAQMMDRNWQVCSSTPAPGEPLTVGTPVDFGVVRIDVESCP